MLVSRWCRVWCYPSAPSSPPASQGAQMAPFQEPSHFSPQTKAILKHSVRRATHADGPADGVCASRVGVQRQTNWRRRMALFLVWIVWSQPQFVPHCLTSITGLVDGAKRVVCVGKLRLTDPSRASGLESCFPSYAPATEHPCRRPRKTDMVNGTHWDVYYSLNQYRTIRPRRPQVRTACFVVSCHAASNRCSVL